MKYLIVSDIHGSISSLRKVLRFYETENCDMLVLLGDILNYGPRNGLPEGLNPMEVAACLNQKADQIVAVRGNCDSEVDQMLLDFPMLADYLLIVDNGKKIFLTHGHLYHSERKPAVHADYFFSGHTHVWKLEKNGATTWCNTGSVTFPKDGMVPGFAVYEDGVVSMYSLDGSLLKSIG